MTKPRQSWIRSIGGLLARWPGIIGGACVLCAWMLIAHLNVVNATVIASPTEVLGVLKDSLTGKTLRDENVFWQSAGTIRRIGLGWFVSLAAGSLIGWILGTLSAISRPMEAVLEFLRSIPPIMAFPLFLIGFNYGESAYVSTIAFGCIPLIAVTVTRGFHETSIVRREMLTVSKATTRTRMAVGFMELLPSYVLAARLSLSISIIVAIVCEMVFTPRSGVALGSLAKNTEMAFNTPVFFACVLIISVVGFIGNWAIQKVERRLGSP